MKTTFLGLAAILLLFTTTFSQNRKQVTFQVDMRPTGLPYQDTMLNVGVRGNVAPLGWVKGIPMQDPDKDGIYVTTVELEGSAEKELIFKYVLNEVEWEGEEVRSISLATKAAETVRHTFRYVRRPENPFRKFLGEWTLKADTWEQSDGKGATERVKIPGHYTLCKEVNTGNSLLWIVDATSSRGHIMWVYNTDKKEVEWVSSFFPNRSGLGKGTLGANGDVQLSVTFEGEPENTYRKYSYTWINDHEFSLRSIQYTSQHEPTGNFYGGTFVRMNPKAPRHRKTQ